MSQKYSYFCTCPRGFEMALAEELGEIAQQSQTLKIHNHVPGGVHCSGDIADAWRINLHSRIASRVLLRIVQAQYKTEDDIYRLALAQDWDKWFDIENTLRVDITAIKSPLRSLDFTTLRIKDGIVDYFRYQFGRRPSIDTKTPDIRIAGFLNADQVTLYLDTSGEALFKRGWRNETGDAPLRENLAAGLLRVAGWKPGMVLFDPMCGSGTILIEAAQILSGIPPGMNRHFAFEKFTNFDPEKWQAIKNKEPLIKSVSEMKSEAHRAQKARHITEIGEFSSTEQRSCSLAQPLNQGFHSSPVPSIPAEPTLFGSDISGDMISITRNNLENAGIKFDIPLKQIEAQEIQPPTTTPGILITNPPYGERIRVRGDHQITEDDMAGVFYSAFGTTIKQRFPGWKLFIFTADLNVPKMLRLKEARKTPFYNGAIECRLFRFDMVAGFNRRQDKIPAKNEK